ncbi:hypothetical protein WMY93_007487 [Mugilogobius chulae]|uniref:G-protein coupled receptors family 1 profile domain-containing protein n=1 Tax=Mugilogobius chulae TaxID=88201 RepID=A0AAW0PP95_9GOBI
MRKQRLRTRGEAHPSLKLKSLEVVNKLLGGKAPGVDEIRPEYLKSLDVVGLSWLTRLCNIAWRTGTVPLDWQTGVVVPLFKKGAGGCVPITEGSHSSASRVVFCPGRGTLDQLYTLHRELEGSWEFAQPVHMCFVDLEKAFDRVPRGVLWGVLREYGVRGPLLRAVRSQYDRSRSCLSSDDGTPGTGSCEAGGHPLQRRDLQARYSVSKGKSALEGLVFSKGLSWERLGNNTRKSPRRECVMWDWEAKKIGIWRMDGEFFCVLRLMAVFLSCGLCDHVQGSWLCVVRVESGFIVSSLVLPCVSVLSVLHVFEKLSEYLSWLWSLCLRFVAVCESEFCPGLVLVVVSVSSGSGWFRRVWLVFFSGVSRVLRFVAVCEPLRYHSIMTPVRLVWLFSGPGSRPCNRGILLLACEPTPRQQLLREADLKRLKVILENSRGNLCDFGQVQTTVSGAGLTMSYFVSTSVFLITAFSYVRILLAVLGHGGLDPVQSRSKALQTVSPHLVVYVLYNVASVIIIISYRFPDISPNLKKFFSVLFIIVPPTVNPIIYGLVSRELRSAMGRQLRRVVPKTGDNCPTSHSRTRDSPQHVHLKNISSSKTKSECFKVIHFGPTRKRKSGPVGVLR